MAPRGQRLACSLRTIDGCIGTYDAYPGETPKSIAKVDPVKWDKPPEKDVMEAAFSIIAEMGMTGAIIRLNQYQWRALNHVKLTEPFYGMILWGGNPMKVIEDAMMLAKGRI
jgi:hypothetical protein